MARLSSIVVLLAIALLVVDAYAYHTTVTTVEVDQDNQGQQEWCRHIRPREQLRSCERFLRQQSSQRGREEEGLEECCDELINVEEQCRCGALEEIARQVQSQEHGPEGSQMLHKARLLTFICRVSPLQC